MIKDQEYYGYKIVEATDMDIAKRAILKARDENKSEYLEEESYYGENHYFPVRSAKVIKL